MNAEGENPKARDSYNWWKALFIPIYLVPMFILVEWHRDIMFYTDAFKSYDDLGRLFGCIAFSCAGFAFLAGLSVKTHKGDMKFPLSYIWKYPLLCVITGVTVFVVWQMNKELRGYLFNISAYPIAFLGGLFSEHTLPLLLKRLRLAD